MVSLLFALIMMLSTIHQLTLSPERVFGILRLLRWSCFLFRQWRRERSLTVIISQSEDLPWLDGVACAGVVERSRSFVHSL